MRKLNRDTRKSKHFGPVVVWADDLKEIFESLQAYEKVSFIADDTQYDSVEEFVQESKGKTPQKVSFSTEERPYVNVELSPLFVELSVYGGGKEKELIALGQFQKLDTILCRCERRPKWAYQVRFILLLFFTVLGMTQLPLPGILEKTLTVSISLIFAWHLFAAYISLWRKGLVRPFFKGDTPGFFRRNRDAIILAVFAAFIGAVFGALTTKLADKFVPSPAPIVEQSSSEKAAKSR